MDFAFSARLLACPCSRFGQRKELLAEEEKLKAEAARIEAMLAALDEED